MISLWLFSESFICRKFQRFVFVKTIFIEKIGMPPYFSLFRKEKHMRSLVYNFVKFVFLIFLPFYFLIRGAVFLHESYILKAWFSITGGIFSSALLLLIYILVIRGKLTGRYGNLRSIKRSYWIGLVVILVYCLPAILYLSRSNTKHEEVRKEYTSLHPILRLGISTVIHLDRNLILTDANRLPEDYRKMGLPTKKHSLHYKQSSGYSHAVDIRVKDRSEFRNWLLERYFRVMGFNTLRHDGTADHLHVSLMSHDRKGAI